jgi:hypothetical protein
VHDPGSLDTRRLHTGGGLALVRAAASEQDAAILLTAAFTGLRRGEVVARAGATWLNRLADPRVRTRRIDVVSDALARGGRSSATR